MGKASRQVVDFTAEVQEYLDYVYGQQTGWAFIAVWGPQQEDWTERAYQWPAQSQELVKDILDDREGVETYICPYLMKTRKRAKGNSVSRRILHTDIDAGVTETLLRMLEEWGFKVIKSGRGKTYHAYIKFSENLSLEDHRKYEITLRDQVKGDKGKITDNDLLRPPLTSNYKQSKEHQVFTQYKGRKLGPKGTQAFLSWLDSINTTPTVTARTRWEEVNLKKPTKILDSVRAVVEDKRVIRGRRSDDAAAAVFTIADNGYTLEQCHAILADFAPGIDKYDRRVDSGGWHGHIDHLWNVWQARNPQPASQELVSKLQLANEKFWKRSLLAHVWDTAIYTRVNPWGLWGMVKLRILHTIPPRVWMPGYGTRSLNTILGIVGPSGSKKSTVMAVARDCVDVGMTIPTRPAGSGEGMLKRFLDKEGKRITAVLFQMEEVSTWNALSERGGTLNAELVKAWNGGDLGFSYSDQAKSVTLDEHTYRFGMYVGIQPTMAETLLDKVGMGLPSRLEWLPAPWEDAPDPTSENPGTMTWEAPEFPEKSRRVNQYGAYVLGMADSVAQEIRDRGEELLGSWEERGLRSQEDALRVKMAFTLAIADGRTFMNEEDWELSGYELAVSDDTRAKVVTALEKERHRKAQKKGETDGISSGYRREYEQKTSQRIHDAKVKKAADQIKDRMDKRGVDRIAESTLKALMTESLVPLFDEARESLGYRIEPGAKKGQVVVRDRPIKARRGHSRPAKG